MDFEMDMSQFEDGVGKLQERIQESADGMINEICTFFVTSAKGHIIQNDSIITGRLLNSIDYEVTKAADGVYIGVVGPREDDFKETGQYGKYVEFGRRALTMDDLTGGKKAFHFFAKDGTEVFATSIREASAKPFMAPAMLQTQAEMPKIISAYLSNL